MRLTENRNEDALRCALANQSSPQTKIKLPSVEWRLIHVRPIRTHAGTVAAVSLAHCDPPKIRFKNSTRPYFSVPRALTHIQPPLCSILLCTLSAVSELCVEMQIHTYMKSYTRTFVYLYSSYYSYILYQHNLTLYKPIALHCYTME